MGILDLTGLEWSLCVIGAGAVALVGLWAVLGAIRLAVYLLTWRGTLRRLLIGSWTPGPTFASWPGNRWWWRED